MLFANNCNTTLNGGITAIATSMVVTSATGFPSPTGSQYFYCTLADAATQTTIEIVKVTAVSGTTFTIVRGQDGTTGTIFASGAVVSLRLVAASLNDFPKLDEANTFTGTITFSTPLLATNMVQSTTSTSGYLSNTDWNTFNGKAPAVTYTTNYVPYGQGTTTPNQSANLQFDGTTLTTANDASLSTVTAGLGGGAVATNTVFGNLAFVFNATGARNAAFGKDALQFNTASNNAGFGYRALFKNTATGNSAFGYQSAQQTTTGTQVCAFGFNALAVNTVGSEVSAFGYNALASNVNGSGCSAFGSYALQSNGAANNNTAIGDATLVLCDASNNTAVGYGSGYSTTGVGNQFFGYLAGNGVTSGAKNVIVGSYTGAAAPISATGSNYVVLSDGDGNIKLTAFPSGGVSIGNTTDPGAGNLSVSGTITSGKDASIHGLNVGLGGGSISTNTAFGVSAINSTASVGGNIGVGYNALLSLGSGSGNTAVGSYHPPSGRQGALYVNSSGNYNCAFGVGTLANNVSGQFNNAFGFGSLGDNTSSNNTAYGTYTLTSNSSGQYNVAVGESALQANTTSNNSTAVGYQAGYNSSGAGNTFLGYTAGKTVTSGSNLTVIGNGAAASSITATNEVTIGNSSVIVTRLGGTTVVASLPSATTVGAGARSFVTDALAPTFGATVIGGGAVPIPVYSDGTNWKVG